MNRVLASILPHFFALLTLCSLAHAQSSRGLEVSDDDGLPVLIKHLPDWQNVRSSTVFANTAADLARAVPGKPVLDMLEFTGGTEAVAATYPAGRLLIIEFTSPQASSGADARIWTYLAANPDPSTVYRRIGNYSVFVLDAPDQKAAVELIDQVKYEKAVQWLGEDPFLLQKFERYFVETSRDIFISTVLWIVSGLGVSIVCGLIAGFVFYRVREQQKATRTAYSDAGGLTRLNLDGLSE
ncbi:MAG: hypothetical protein HOP17_18015 [Acidobacteria bacterium]|nr:hypothetical protein [Acidobacteriota bacterium]